MVGKFNEKVCVEMIESLAQFRSASVVVGRHARPPRLFYSISKLSLIEASAKSDFYCPYKQKEREVSFSETQIALKSCALATDRLTLLYMQ